MRWDGEEPALPSAGLGLRGQDDPLVLHVRRPDPVPVPEALAVEALAPHALVQDGQGHMASPTGFEPLSVEVFR